MGAFVSCSAGLSLLGRLWRHQPSQYIVNMLGADTAVWRGTFKHQLHRYQHRLKTGLWHHGQHFSHDAVTPGVSEQHLAQT